MGGGGGQRIGKQSFPFVEAESKDGNKTLISVKMHWQEVYGERRQGKSQKEYSGGI